MNRDNDTELNNELREEYDFSQIPGGIHGKYVSQYRKGTNLVLLEPDVAQVFPDSKSVNEALRALAKIIQQSISANNSVKKRG